MTSSLAATRPQSRGPLSQTLGLLACAVVSFATAGLGAAASVQAVSFYAQLAQPSWAPPAGVFGPVWSLLFSLMAVAAWLVWRQPVSAPGRRAALALFLVQLAANALWSWLFFGWHLGVWAMVDVVLLFVLIAATMRAFARLRPLAAALLLPYLLWVGFAAALTWALWQANPTLL